MCEAQPASPAVYPGDQEGPLHPGQGVPGFSALPRGCGVGGVTLGPPSTSPAAPAHVTVQGARGDRRGAGQVPHGCFPRTPPRRRGCGDLERSGSVSQEVGAGRGRRLSPCGLCICSAPPWGPRSWLRSPTRAALVPAASGQALHFPRPLCLSLRKEHLIKNASGAPRLSLCHTHSSGPGHPRGG